MSEHPTLFLSHGSPMHVIESGPAGEAWRELGATLPRPRAVLIVSAHWETAAPVLTGAARPDTIHDFGGFPQELFALRYPAPGSPQLAQRAAALLQAAGHAASISADRGLDHGAWVPLQRMYPQADVPVVQLSIQTALGPAHHLRIGAALEPLAAEGVLVIGSGSVTHNLRDWMITMQRASRGRSLDAAIEPLPYVTEFADWLEARLAAGDREAVLDYRARSAAGVAAHPTPRRPLPSAR